MMRTTAHSRVAKAFTIIEMMIAIAILAAVFAAIYACWSAVSRGTQIGLKAAAEAHRDHMMHRLIEESLMSVVMYQANQRHYYFAADTTAEFASLTFVSQVPPSFPGSGVFGKMNLRRLAFYVASDTNGVPTLMLSQMPLLLVTNELQEPYVIPLARGVMEFRINFWEDGPQGGQWAEEWTATNRLPRMVQYFVALKAGSSPASEPVVTSGIVSVPSISVPPIYQGIQTAGGQGNAPPRQRLPLTPSR